MRRGAEYIVALLAGVLAAVAPVQAGVHNCQPAWKCAPATTTLIPTAIAPTVVVTPPTTTSPTAATGARLSIYGNFAAAIAAAPSHGHVVIVDRSIATDVVRPYAGLTIRGEPGYVISRIGTPSVPDVGLFDVRVSDATLQGLTIRGTGVRGGQGDDILIYGVGAHRLAVLDVRLEDAQGIGIQTQDSTGLLVEDVAIVNTFVRDNGYHGVALWPYHGTRDSTFRRITIDGADYAGVFLDAGTADGDGSSVDGNSFEDIYVRSGARYHIADGGTGAAIILTGAQGNAFTRWTVESTSQALGFGADQSGLPATGNVLREGRTLAVSIVAAFGGQTGNTVQGQGPGTFVGAAGNTVVWTP